MMESFEAEKRRSPSALKMIWVRDRSCPKKGISHNLLLSPGPQTLKYNWFLRYLSKGRQCIYEATYHFGWYSFCEERYTAQRRTIMATKFILFWDKRKQILLWQFEKLRSKAIKL